MTRTRLWLADRFDAKRACRLCGDQVEPGQLEPGQVEPGQLERRGHGMAVACLAEAEDRRWLTSLCQLQFVTW
jgi:hypothetical protein